MSEVLRDLVMPPEQIDAVLVEAVKTIGWSPTRPAGMGFRRRIVDDTLGLWLGIDSAQDPSRSTVFLFAGRVTRDGFFGDPLGNSGPVPTDDKDLVAAALALISEITMPSERSTLTKDASAGPADG
ncbi:hypothetical protein [Streptomyces sp. NPDC056244]|uniref:hypothetical protein n=1 Tax=Streptomyces sp. NPDC056244 TaxID=3345762 RepID=UPI0035E1279C